MINRVLDYLLPDRVEVRRIDSLPTVEERDDARIELIRQIVRGELGYPWLIAWSYIGDVVYGSFLLFGLYCLLKWLSQ